MVRVLYLIASGRRGGAEKITADLAIGHDRRRFEPVVLYLEDGPLIQLLRDHGVEVLPLKSRMRLRSPYSVWRCGREIRQICEGLQVSLIHCCMSYMHLPASLAGRERPIVVFQHGPIGGWLDRISSALPRHTVLVNSRYSERQYRGLAVRDHSIVRLPMGTQIVRPATSQDHLRKEWGMGREDFVIVTLGRIDPNKGVKRAIAAILKSMTRFPQLRLAVGGEAGPSAADYKAELQDFVEASGCRDRVRFVGEIADPASFLAAGDLFVHTPYSEAFGLVIAEAMTCGTPVVATRVGGIPEIVDDGGNGRLVDSGPQFADAFRTLVEELIGDAAQRSRLRSRAFEDARRFRFAETLGAVEEVYEGLLKIAPAKSM